jgi:hypothetical protein
MQDFYRMEVGTAFNEGLMNPPTEAEFIEAMHKQAKSTTPGMMSSFTHRNIKYWQLELQQHCHQLLCTM